MKKYLILILCIQHCFILNKEEQNIKNNDNIFSLPSLPYPYNAFKDIINEETMIIHHTKHHQAYINNLNTILAKPEFETFKTISLESLLSTISTLNIDPINKNNIKNQAGGVYNRSFFWNCLTNHYKEPSKKLDLFFKTYFINFDHFKKEFIKKANSHFGSGWCWLIYDEQKKEYSIELTSNQDCPLTQSQKPLLCIDLLEHAYYLDYQNKKLDYLNNIFSIINWNFVEENINNIIS